MEKILTERIANTLVAGWESSNTLVNYRYA